MAARLTHTNDEALRLHLIHQADADQAAYPQYRGHFDGYQLATAKTQIKCHGRVVVERGERVLYDPASVAVMTESFNENLNGRLFATFYLHRNLSGVDTSLRCDKFLGVEAPS